MYCEYTLSIWPVIAVNIRTKKQSCACVVVPMAVRQGKRVQSLEGNFQCAATTVCMYLAHLGLHGSYWGGGTKFRGKLSFGVIVSGADGCIFKGGGTNSRGSTSLWGNTVI